jgi:hypothetical protein
MVDYASEGILKLARGRARWFWIPIAGWSLLTLSALRYPTVLLVFASVDAMFIVFWYFASQGREWPFLVGAILAGLNAIVGILSVYGIVGGLLAALVCWRLWDSFITCCSLASTKSLHAQLVDRLTIPSRIANAGPRNVFKPDLPRRVADESDGPAPTAWQPYRPPTTIDGPPEATA